MPKNKGRGGNKRRRAKNTSGDVKRQLDFKDEGQEYAQVLKLLGSGRCEVYCFDGVKRLGIIRGKLIKRVYIHPGEIVLVSLRDFTKDGKKCDIVHKYFPDEAKKLKAHGEIPENIEQFTDQKEYEDTNAQIVFGGESEGDDDEENKDDDDEDSKPRARDMPSSSDEDDEDEDDDDEEKKIEEGDEDDEEDDDEENDDDEEDEDEDDEEEEEDAKPNKWDNKNKWASNTKTTAPPVKDKRLKDTGKKKDDDYNIDDI